MYTHMWNSFAQWAVVEGIALEELDDRALEAFLLSRPGRDDLSDRYAWRFLRLIERVAAVSDDTRDRIARAVAKTLHAHPQWQHANAAEREPPLDALSPEDARQLVSFLSGVRRAGVDSTWQDIRNRAATGLMLGAGLTPGEIRSLTLDAVVQGGGRSLQTPWKLRVGTGRAMRETPIASWAGQLLRFWLDVRAEQAIPGAHVFPSTRRSGKAWGKVAQYLATKEVLEAAGLTSLDGGSYRLRHTFALRQLRRGKRPSDVATWLGVTDPNVMARYRRILWAPVDVE